MEIISRKDAKARGLVRYFTGKACVRGHVSERYVRSTHCLECRLENSHRKYLKNLERSRERSRENHRRARKKAGFSGRKKLTEEDRRAASRAQNIKFRELNPTYMREYLRAWRAANRDKRNADKRAREIRKRRETIAILGKAQNGRCAYCRCKSCLARLEV